MTGPVLQNAAFRRVFAASTASVFGSMMSALAVPWMAIEVIGADDASVAGLQTLRLVPGFVLGFAIGIRVDRLPRRLLMIGADLGRALLLVSVPVAFLLGALNMLLLGAVVLAVDALTLLFDLSAHSLLPSVLPPEDLIDGNATITGGAAVAEGLGFASAGPIARLVGVPFVLAADAGTYLLSAALLLGVRVEEQTESTPRHGSDVRHAWAEIRRVPELRAIAEAEILRGVAHGIFATSYMLWVLRGLDLGLVAIGVIAAAGSAASLVGAWLAPRVTRALGAERGMWVSLAATALASLLIPLAPDAAWLGVLCLLGHQLAGDASETAWDVQQITVRQRLTRPELLGRVNGGIHALGSAATLGTALACIALVESLGPRGLLFAAPVATAAGALLLRRALDPRRRA